jgi:hypothetical protein
MDGRTDGLVGRLSDWLVDGLTDWWTQALIDWLIDMHTNGRTDAQAVGVMDERMTEDTNEILTSRGSIIIIIIIIIIIVFCGFKI